MFWRLVSIVGILFWAVMAGLLVRDTYFPEESRFAEVPPKMVLDMFLTHRGSTSSMLLYRDDTKLGHANVSVGKESAQPGQAPFFRLRGSGLIDGEMLSRPGSSLSWLLESELGEDSTWRRLQFQSRLVPPGKSAVDGHDTVVLMSWQAGDAIPFFEVREGSRTIVDSKIASALIQNGTIPLGGLLSSSAASANPNAPGFAQVSAREGLMRLAGKRRKCYVLAVQLAGIYEIKALFTEAGELASIELPQGYRLLDPGIHELAPTTEP